MTFLTTETLKRDLGDLLLASMPNLPPKVTGISIDTRTIQPEELFVALQGDHFDGHAYVAQAFEKGAAAAIVSKTGESSYPVLTVKNVDEALVALGQGGRRRASKAKIIGVTGSVGKTGTKEALRHVLSAQGLAHANPASFNNHWGTPLSLARMPHTADFGIFEMGMNSPGEIAALTRQIRPHIALITVIGAAHKGFFPSLEAIADAKAEIFQGLEPDGIAILSQDDPLFEHLKQQAITADIRSIITFGTQAKADIRLLEATLGENSSRLKVSYGGTLIEGQLAHPGRHWISNALGVLGVLFALNWPADRIFERLSNLPPLPGRGRRVALQLPRRTLTLLDESYNANPTSMTAALALLAQQNSKARRVAILGDMLELGEAEVQDHENLIGPIQQLGIDLVFTCGPLMKSLDSVLPPSQRGGWAATVEALFPLLNEQIQDGDVLMIKGSKKMQLGRVLESFHSLEMAS